MGQIIIELVASGCRYFLTKFKHKFLLLGYSWNKFSKIVDCLRCCLSAQNEWVYQYGLFYAAAYFFLFLKSFMEFKMCVS